MQGTWILFFAAQIIYSFAGYTSTKTRHQELMYNQRFTISLPTEAERLEFVSETTSRKDVLWTRHFSAKRGTISGKDSGRKFSIMSVTFDDEGTYTVTDFWHKKIYIVLLRVNTQRRNQNRVAGETLSISLDGLSRDDATVYFSNPDWNITLVKNGLPVGNSHLDYIGRIKLTGNSIEVLNVNISDVGDYTLLDRLNRKVKIISMDLVDHHEAINSSPFMGLLLLLGIPPCIFCCCRKKICKKKKQPTTTTTTLDTQLNPNGPPPNYINPAVPAGPTPAFTPGLPAAGGTTVYPPFNPSYPPQQPYDGYPATSPAMPPNPGFNPGYPPPSGFLPAQPPQWGGAPYNQPAPSGFAPMMYNAPAAPEPVKGEVPPTTPQPVGVTPVMHNAPSAAEPVKGGIPPTTPPQSEVAQPSAPHTGVSVLNSSDSAVQFNIGMAKDSGSNFL